MKAPRRALGVHSSGRFDRSNEQLARSVRRLRKTTRGKGLLRRRVAWITGTEGDSRDDRELKRIMSQPGWDYTRFAGRGTSELWATWDNRIVELASQPYVVQLTDQTWVRGEEFGGNRAPYVHALVLAFRPVGRPNRRTVYVFVLHAPLDNTEVRAAAWRSVCRGIRTEVTKIRARDPHAVFALNADWNKDYRNAAERAQIQQAVARPLRLVQAWDGSTPKRGGTHGQRRLIDGTVATRVLLGATTPWCWLLPDDASSDHRPYAHTIRWPLLPKRIRKPLRNALPSLTSKE